MIDLGPLQATVDKKETIQLTPLSEDWHSSVTLRCWSLEPGECSKVTIFSPAMVQIMGSVSMHRAL